MHINQQEEILINPTSCAIKKLKNPQNFKEAENTQISTPTGRMKTYVWGPQ